MTWRASMKAFVPDFAIVPRLLTKSAFVIPTPVSITVSVLSACKNPSNLPIWEADSLFSRLLVNLVTRFRQTLVSKSSCKSKLVAAYYNFPTSPPLFTSSFWEAHVLVTFAEHTTHQLSQKLLLDYSDLFLLSFRVNNKRRVSTPFSAERSSKSKQIISIPSRSVIATYCLGAKQSVSDMRSRLKLRASFMQRHLTWSFAKSCFRSRESTASIALFYSGSDYSDSIWVTLCFSYLITSFWKQIDPFLAKSLEM